MFNRAQYELKDEDHHKKTGCKEFECPYSCGEWRMPGNAHTSIEKCGEYLADVVKDLRKRLADTQEGPRARSKCGRLTLTGPSPPES